MSSESDDSLALTVECPICQAPEYSPCVYVWPKGVAECYFPDGYYTCIQHSDAQHERLAKVGTPTKVAHNARKNVVFNRRVRERQLATHRQLSDWLTQYGDIFAEDGGM